jgi:hypothetical protein
MACATSIFVERGNSSLNEIQGNSLLFYPNPMKNELFIQSETDIDKFEIY